tara:strand:- start:34 stop:447 length:414 start_codon:yes stop_codon:yes gene_type:complete
MDISKLKAELAEAKAKIETLTAVAKYECSTWISSVPNNNGNLASPINLPMIGNDGNVVKQKNADGYDVVAGTEYKAWVQLIPSKDKNGNEGFIIKLTGKAKSDVEYEAEQKLERPTINNEGTVEAPAKKEASTEVPF